MSLEHANSPSFNLETAPSYADHHRCDDGISSPKNDKNQQDTKLETRGTGKEDLTGANADIVGTGEPFSAFTERQKKWIVFIAAMAGWFSTTSSFIYFPAIPFLARDLHVSIEQINLTVTSYLVASGIFPSIVGSAADYYGRRPVFIVSLSVYVGVNVGLALQRSFAALVTLRMVQSAAISGTYRIQPSIFWARAQMDSRLVSCTTLTHPSWTRNFCLCLWSSW